MKYKHLQIFDSGKIIASDELPESYFMHIHQKPMVVTDAEVDIANGSININGTEMECNGKELTPRYNITISISNFTFIYQRELNNDKELTINLTDEDKKSEYLEKENPLAKRLLAKQKDENG